MLHISRMVRLWSCHSPLFGHIHLQPTRSHCVLALGLSLAAAAPLKASDEDDAPGRVSIRLQIRPQTSNSTDLSQHQANKFPQELVWSKGIRKLPRKPSMPELPLTSLCMYEAEGDDKSQHDQTTMRDAGHLAARPLRLAPSFSTEQAHSDSEKEAQVESERPTELDPEAQPREALVQGAQPNAEPAKLAQSRQKQLEPLSPTRAPKRLQIIIDPSNNEYQADGSGDAPVLESQPDDIPLQQEEHPFDAPPAKSTEQRHFSDQLPETTVWSPREQAIERGIQNCLNYYLTNPENISRRGPWALMHAVLPFGVETEIVAGKQRVNGIGWMCFNGVCSKQRMFQPTRTGFRPNVGPGVQGHEGQFLAILAQSKVSPDYPLQIGNKRYTIHDLVRYEMATCREKTELTFKLIGLSHYLPQDARWRDNRGQTWNLEKMVAEEIAQPVIGAACGGTHRLMGLSYAIHQRAKAGLPLNGHFQRAELYLDDYVRYALSLQNPDGSFSTEWFEGRGMDVDVERKVQTTGHVLEWLIFTLPEEDLRSAEIQKSVEFLLGTVGAKPQHNWPIGPRGHALRAMSLYGQRVYGAKPGQMAAFVAERQQPATSR